MLSRTMFSGKGSTLHIHCVLKTSYRILHTGQFVFGVCLFSLVVHLHCAGFKVACKHSQHFFEGQLARPLAEACCSSCPGPCLPSTTQFLCGNRDLNSSVIDWQSYKSKFKPREAEYKEWSKKKFTLAVCSNSFHLPLS